ncbi:CFA47 protein, partial [Polypterus senegalus]
IAMEADVWGVRISPPFLEFLDVKVGFTYRGTVTVKNISKTSKRLRINGPVSKLFKLSVANQDKPIAPGLMLTAVVEYIPEKDEDFRDRLILLADEDVIEIPLLAMCPSCYLEIETEVDFGFVVANSRLISKEIEISNHGSAPGVFKIYSVSNLPVKIQPPSGIVQPKTTQKIKFELTTDKATNFEEFVKVKLQDSEDVVIKIKADIVEQVLELLNTANQRIECVRFGAAYFGTSKLQQAVLYNNSPQAINWVAILQDDAEGADVGNDWDSSTDATLLEMRIRQKLDGIDIAMLISCFPNQGSLGPYEKTTVILHFSPIYNRLTLDIRGNIVSYVLNDWNRFKVWTDDERGHNHVELALTGTGLPVILMATPAPPYDFKECYMGEQVDIQCSLQNQSLLLPVLYSSRKTANFSIFPSKGKINPGMQQTLRYNYVDPDYAYTEEEDEQRKAHREYYAHFLKSLREQRLQKEKDREMGDVKGKDDLGMKSAAGIFPKKLLLGDIEVNQQVTDGLNVVPTTQEETEDCKMTLSAQQLHQIIIGPSVVDFGEVCLHSISSKPLNIVNNLPVHIWVQFEIDCLELQQTSPLSHVVPPMSRAFLPIIFETNDLGKFQRSVTYTINKNHVGHVLVLGQVVPVTLELSTQELILTPNSCFLAESGFRSTITLRNPQNHPAEFTWKPIITENGIAFSIRPATGSVDAYRELECEVVWHPSYYSPVDGEFDLIVHEGNTARLKCLAMLGSTSVEFTEKHVVFGSVAQNLTAIKTATLQNNGQNHAYFQVFDPNPLPGMTIIPSEGVVPVGGSLDLVLYFIPDAVMKFDTRVEVGIRNTKSSELRIGGSVEMPQVEIDVKNFRFPGVYSGSVQEIPFTLQNKTAVRARVEFDLSDHPEFAIKFIDCTGEMFKRYSVAAYDFSLPVNINSAVAPSPPPSSLPKTPSIIEKHLVTPRPHTIAVTTPSRRIQATGESGIYNLNVPIFINDDYIHPFRSITLSGVIKIPKIIFDPPSLILAPVPLETEVGAMISIIPSEYIRNCFVNVELPEIELEDGTNIKPFTLKFLSGQQIITLSNGKNKILTCQIIFKSSRPVSDVSDIVFIDEHQQRFVLSVVATADNCLLTAYPYLALHLSDQQIVLKSGCLNGVNSKQNTGEAILHPCYTPATHSRSTSSSSTFIVLSSTCDESFPESAEENLNGSVKKSDEIDQQGFKNIFGFPTFPMENTEEGHFFRMMLYAVQKWFSLFGWPKGPRPISIPESLRSGVCKNQSSGSSVRKSSFRSSRGKEANTVYDMLFHLSGQVLQGITTTQALPTDHTKRVLQLHWQHSSLITFLKAHGACLAYIRPEFLFEPDDFKHWNSIQSQLGQLQNKKANGMDKPGDISLTGIEDIYFESLSKRAWTDVLLQIYKISTHLVNIYTNPTSLEQCLHNALLLVKAFHAINLEIDVQATDISDPNPIMMIMLCVYLYEKLPQYVPKKTIEFSVGLHCSSIRQVLLKNTSSKALVYTATIIGKESEDFVIVKGNTVTIAPRGQTNVTVEFTSRFLRPVESILLLTAKLSTGPHGGTLVFTLRSNITSITSSGVIKCSSPCYELNKCHVTTTNPFKKDGEFSYPMSGSEFYSRDIASLDNNQDTSLGTTGQVNQLNEFFSPVESVFLECRGSANIEIHYLPFHLGKRYCSILFLNEKVGEFLYSVEGESTLPLPQPLIPVESSHIAHISGAGKGKRSEKPVLIFKCLMDSCLEEKLKIPLVNEAREKALAAVAQQRMSFVEFERRKITGTLQSSSVRAAMAALGLSETETRPVPATLENKYRSIDYKVEVSMPEHFKFPKKISIPVSTTSANSLKSTLLAVKTTEDAVEIPLIFHPKAPGRYPCQIVLHSSRDVRVHLIECVVNSEETEADLMFVTPALQTVTQDIPISNKTLQEWSIQGVIEGNGFYGPSVINVRAGEKVQYPLMFKPMCEGITLGKLTLQNYTDGTRQIFGLRGVGKKPLAFDHAVIDCRVGQLAQKVLMVPNFTQTRLICKVVSDLAIVSGFPFLELKPGQSTSYTISIDPRRRGKQTGVISFVAEDGEDQQPPHNKAVNQTDGKQAIQRLAGETFSALDDSKEVSHIYKVWFSLEIIAAPPPSVQIIAVKCPIHTKTTVDIPISNPSNETMHLDVLLRGAGLSGDSYLVLKPMEKVSYLVSYFSSFTGRATGSVIFQSDKVAEFWYELDLTTEKPLPTIFPPLQCELGKWTRHFIPLVNPTDETLQLQAFNSNPKHFSVELGPKKSLTMAPHSSANVPVHFCPSALGRANHKTSVSFKCRQIF